MGKLCIKRLTDTTILYMLMSAKTEGDQIYLNFVTVNDLHKI